MSSKELKYDWVRVPVGHEERIEGLWRAAREGRLSHALGFFGPRGVGKFLAARWFAAGLFCKDPDSPRPGPPCGICGPCKRLKANTHPDVFMLDPIAMGVEAIRIQDVVHRDDSERQTVDEFLTLKAAEGGYRVVLLRDFDRANPHAQNALLKTLEEPGSDVVLILESSAPARLVGTVKSRIVNVAFDRLGLAATGQALADLGFDEEAQRHFGRWCHGAPGRAVELSAFGADGMVALIEAALRGQDALVLVSELAAVKAPFPGKTPSMKARARARYFLDLVLEVCTDLLRAVNGQDAEELAYGDLVRLAGLDSLSGTGRRAVGLRTAVDLCLAARQDVDMNLSPDAACERAFLALAQVNEKEQV